jgi:hypothetical protein
VTGSDGKWTGSDGMGREVVRVRVRGS